jgi:hypothetical protein
MLQPTYLLSISQPDGAASQPAVVPLQQDVGSRRAERSEGDGDPFRRREEQ